MVYVRAQFEQGTSDEAIADYLHRQPDRTGTWRARRVTRARTREGMYRRDAYPKEKRMLRQPEGTAEITNWIRRL